jgi:hypothetical protein
MSEVEEKVAEAAPEQAPQSLTIEDLRLAAGAIELGATRGAYRANEFKVIGGIWEKMTAFLNAAQATLQEQQAQAEVPVAGDGVEVTEDAPVVEGTNVEE